MGVAVPELVYTAGMVVVRTRGYFGIGAEGVSKSANVGALLRTGHAFGASFCFTIGSGWDSRAARTADTADTPSHVPMWRYPSLTELSLPHECVLVGIELLDDAVDPFAGRDGLAGFRVRTHRSPVAFALIQFIGNRAFDDQDECLQNDA